MMERLIPNPVKECLEDPLPDEEDSIISRINPHNFDVQINTVKKVKNSFLEAMYELKKAELKCRYGSEPREQQLIHVTSGTNANNIIKENFDWRRVTRSKFGLGTSFSDDAEYANYYANWDIGLKRAFIITKVLVTRSTSGDQGQILPPSGCDTTTGNNMKVYVKYDDNEMLPMYVAYYTCRTLPRGPRGTFRVMRVDYIDVKPTLLLQSNKPNYDKAKAHNELTQVGYPTQKSSSTVIESISELYVQTACSTFPDASCSARPIQEQDSVPQQDRFSRTTKNMMLVILVTSAMLGTIILSLALTIL